MTQHLEIPASPFYSDTYTNAHAMSCWIWRISFPHCSFSPIDGGIQIMLCHDRHVLSWLFGMQREFLPWRGLQHLCAHMSFMETRPSGCFHCDWCGGVFVLFHWLCGCCCDISFQIQQGHVSWRYYCNLWVIKHTRLYRHYLHRYTFSRRLSFPNSFVVYLTIVYIMQSKFWNRGE